MVSFEEFDYVGGFEDRPCEARAGKRNRAWTLSALRILARASGMKGYTRFRTKAELCKALRMPARVSLRKPVVLKTKKVKKIPVGIAPQVHKGLKHKKKKKLSAKALKVLYASFVDCKRRKAYGVEGGSKFPGKMPLKEHQIKAVERVLMPNIHGILLYFTVGSGKTLSAIACAEALFKCHPQSCKGALIVTPASLVENMKKELKASNASVQKYKVVSYDKMLKLDSSEAKERILVIDEAHNLRNAGGAKLKKGMALARKAFKVVLLTGTPVQNHPYEFAPLLNMLYKDKVVPGDPQAFDGRYGHSGLDKHGEELKHLVQNNFLHYASPAASGDYPTLEIKDVTIAMSPEQIEQHKKVTDRMKGDVNRIINGQGDKKFSLSFYVHPRMVANAATTDDRVTISPKCVEILKNVKSAVANKRKSLVYSFFVERGVSIIKGMLDREKIKYKCVTGKESASAKKQAVEDYNAGRVKILIISAAGGEGLDLKNTSYVHVLEPSWNQERISQVIGRARRYKSHTDKSIPNKVTVYRYHCEMRKPPAGEKATIQNTSADTLIRLTAERKDRVNKAFVDKLIAWSR